VSFQTLDRRKTGFRVESGSVRLRSATPTMMADLLASLGHRAAPLNCPTGADRERASRPEGVHPLQRGDHAIGCLSVFCGAGHSAGWSGDLLPWTFSSRASKRLAGFVHRIKILWNDLRCGRLYIVRSSKTSNPLDRRCARHRVAGCLFS